MIAYYYTRDHEASVRELCNSSGMILTRYSYDPYGRTTPTYESANTSTPPIGATFQYTDDYYHATSGLNLTKYRAFDSNTGRWLSRDPINEKGGLNLYEYARDNSINLIDPLGLDTTTMTINIVPGGPFSNPNVTITAKSSCCTNIEFIQYVIARYLVAPVGSTKLDNSGQPASIFYQIDAIAPDGTTTMTDSPGAANAAMRLLMVLGSPSTDLVQEFVTCAVCRDKGANNNKILACIHWKTINNGFGGTGMSAENYPPPGSKSK